MNGLHLPVLSGSSSAFYPPDRRCPVCGDAFAEGIAYLSGGALLLSKDRQNSVHNDRLEAFLNVGFHGKDPGTRDSGDMMVVDRVSGGQFDLQWCSVRCMRAWLMQLLDELEASIRRDDEVA